MKLLIIAGSSRKESLNQHLQNHLADVAEGLGMTVNVYPATALEAPIYNGDDEEGKGIPEAIQQLTKAVDDADKVVIVSPEYNASVPPLLKNAIDWTSRDDIGVWKHKTVLLAAASPGGLGGIRALSHLRDILGNIKAWTAPTFASCKNASPEAIKNMDREFLANFLQQSAR